MGTLFVDRQHSELNVRAGVIAISSDAAPTQQVPMQLVDRIVLRANTRLSSRVLAALADADIGLLALGGRSGQRIAQLVGAPGRDAQVRINQIRQLGNAEFQQAWCRRLLQSKLRSQQRLLLSALRQRPDLRKPMFDAIGTLRRTTATLAGTAEVATMRGLEGAAAAAHFRALATLFPSTLGFVGRRRRPPPDPVNAVLSLGYTLLHALALEVTYGCGLDPMIGYLHTPTAGRSSMACDLMEPWRPRVDRLAWTLFRTRTLTADHFGHQGNGACLLNKAGRSHFYPAWALILPPLRRAMRKQAALARAAMGDLASAESSDQPSGSVS